MCPDTGTEHRYNKKGRNSPTPAGERVGCLPSTSHPPEPQGRRGRRAIEWRGEEGSLFHIPGTKPMKRQARTVQGRRELIQLLRFGSEAAPTAFQKDVPTPCPHPSPPTKRIDRRVGTLPKWKTIRTQQRFTRKAGLKRDDRFFGAD